MAPFRAILVALILAPVGAFAPVFPISKAQSSSLVALHGSKDDFFSNISKLGVALADPKKAITKALAGEYDEEAAKAKVEGFISKEPVLMFSFTTCPFCLKAKEILDAKNAKYTVVELNEVEDGPGMRVEMASIIGRTSVPAVFIDGEFIGGCNDGGKGGIVTLQESGELDTLLKGVGAI